MENSEKRETEIRLQEEFIKLGQALKAAHVADNGAEAKMLVQNGQAMVNGTVDTRRGKKLYAGDVVSCHGVTIHILK